MKHITYNLRRPLSGSRKVECMIIKNAVRMTFDTPVSVRLSIEDSVAPYEPLHFSGPSMTIPCFFLGDHLIIALRLQGLWTL